MSIVKLFSLISPSLRVVEQFKEHRTIFLKGKSLDVIDLSRNKNVRTVFKFPSSEILNSGICVIHTKNLVAFSEKNRILLADSQSIQGMLVDVSAIVENDWEVNWKISVDSKISSIYLTLLPKDNAPTTTRICQIDLKRNVFSYVVDIEQLHSGAYTISAEHGVIAWIKSEQGGNQRLCIKQGDLEKNIDLLHRYDFIEISPSSTHLLLSRGVDFGNISTVDLTNPLPMETVLQSNALAASWAGDERIVFYGNDKEIKTCSMANPQDAKSWIKLEEFANEIYLLEPPTTSHDGKIVVCSWITSSNCSPQRSGTFVFDIENEECFFIEQYWYRASIL